MKRKETVICMIIAFLITIALAFYCYLGVRGEEQYDVVIFGDSVLGNERGSTSVDKLMENITGKTVYNAAIGGTCATQKENNVETSDLKAALDLKSMVDAVYSGNYGQLNSVVNYGTGYISFHYAILPYFKDSVEGLKEVDFSTVETMIISYGINDYMQGTNIENTEDKFDVKTLKGSLSYAITMLKARYPDTEIILTTPMNLVLDIDGQVIDGSVAMGEYELEAYVNTILEVGQEYDVTVVDFYSEINITKENWQEYLFDGLHPNETARMKIAELLSDAIGF